MKLTITECNTQTLFFFSIMGFRINLPIDKKYCNGLDVIVTNMSIPTGQAKA